jgi:hypothetical protein
MFLFKPINLKSSDQDQCFLQTNKVTQYNEQLLISNFDEINELNFNCKQQQAINNISILAIQPNKPTIILDNSFDLRNIKLNPKLSFLTILLNNFKGFDLNSNPFRHLNHIKIVFSIELIFDLYLM